MIYGIDRTNRGNYICPFCTKRKMMKSQGGILNHVEKDHPTDCRVWNIENAKNAAERRAELAEQKLAAYTQQQKSKPKQEYYDAIVFCTTCRRLKACGMPKGTLPSNVTCPNCGVCTLHLLDNVEGWRRND